MQKHLKIVIIFTVVFFALSALLIKFNALFITNKDVELSDIKVNSENVYKPENDNDKKKIYPVTLNKLYLTKISIGKQTRYVKVWSLKKDKYIDINIISFKNGKFKRNNYHLYLLHKNFPELIIENKGIKKGYIFANFTAGQDFPAHVFIMDIKGNIVFYRTIGELNRSVFHLQKWITKDKKVFYGLHEVSEHSSNNMYTGAIIVLDKKFNVINRVKALATSKHPELEAEEHDFILLDKNHYIVQANWVKELQENSKTVSYIDNVIQEIKDGNVIFDWIASEQSNFKDNNFVLKGEVIADSYGKYKVPILINGKGNKIKSKYKELINDNYKKCDKICEEFHINSLAIDPKDNNLLVSFKYKNAVIKIDRKTGEILWQLGGNNDNFKLTEDEKFKLQHHTHFENNDTFYIFDNISKNTSRILKYKFDKEHKNIIKKEFMNLNDFIHVMGSIQMIDDNKMIVSYGNSLKTAIKIIDSNGNVYWSAKFNDKVVKIRKMGNIYNSIYRAYYYEKVN